VALGAAAALYQCDDLPKPRRVWTSSAGALIAVHLELGAWERGVRLMLDAPEVISFSPGRVLSGRIFDLDDLFARVDLPWSALARRLPEPARLPVRVAVCAVVEPRHRPPRAEDVPQPRSRGHTRARHHPRPRHRPSLPHRLDPHRGDPRAPAREDLPPEGLP